MDTKEQAAAVNPEEEFKKLREKTDKEEMTELKRGLLGGYKQRDVASFVGRLKSQLQTTERTYKAHIAEISAEKDQLRIERDSLAARLAQLESSGTPSFLLQTELSQAKRAAEGFLADKGTLEDKLMQVSRLADETIAGLQCRTTTLEEELRQSKQHNEEQQSELDALREEAQETYHKEKDALLAEKNAVKMQMEGLQVQFEAFVCKSEESEAELRSEINALNCRIEAEKAVALEYAEKLGETSLLLEELKCGNADQACQLDVARQNIATLLAAKETLEDINEQMRVALNSLVVKADAVIKENNVINGLLDTEREKVQQYQAMNEKLADMLARVRMANQMLDERVLDLDKALSWGNGQMTKPGTAQPRRVMRDDLMDFSDGKSSSLKEIISELNAIQTSLAQYQQPSRLFDEADKKPNIRYSVEKLEVDCTGAMAEKTPVL